MHLFIFLLNCSIITRRHFTYLQWKHEECVCVCVCVCVYVCMYVLCIYVCVYVWMYVLYIHMYLMFIGPCIIFIVA